MSDRPEDVDAAFAAIVADLEREGLGSNLSDLDDPGSAEETTAPAPPPAPAPKPQSSPPPAAWRGQETEWDWTWGTDDEHYVPPEPPPLPRLRPLTIVALVLILAAVVLLVLPGVIGLDARIGTPIALVALTCGGAMLLLRIRQTPKEPEDGRDDGAQI
ncbi:MAG TPA: hypothetical protein VH969_22885 [Actinophytocola sp.]|uniref:hypothetical protein n=1 Tax=Actinophytocola sp. TaxID=1872138 RepID=UPI002F92FE38